jgi:hypothetical protein
MGLALGGLKAVLEVSVSTSMPLLGMQSLVPILERKRAGL